jgi:hypothetical protein
LGNYHSFHNALSLMKQEVIKILIAIKLWNFLESKFLTRI